MTGEAGFDELSRSELLDAATLLADAEREAQVDQLRLAAHWAAMNGPDTVDPDLAGLPGRPSLRFYGGHATPQVASVAGADLGARLGRSTTYGDNLIADAVDLQFRLTELWGRVQAREVLASYARHVARKTRELEPEEAAYVDSRVAEFADGRVTWSRFEALVDAAVVAAAPAVAAAREELARLQKFARATRSSVDGMRGFYVRTDAAGVAKLDATVAHLAQILADLGSTGPLDVRRAQATVILASPGEAVKLLAAYHAWRDRPADPVEPEPCEPDVPLDLEDLEGPENPSEPASAAEPAESTDPAASVIADAVALWDNHGDGHPLGDKPVLDWSALLPTVVLYVHLYGGRIRASDLGNHAIVGADRGEAPGLARLEGIGVATEAWLRTHLAMNPAHKLTVKPVIDLEGQAPVDSWEIPDRHREAVRLVTPADVFPWGSATANQSGGWSGMQVDHTEPWQTGGTGQSRIGNYGPLTQRHHNLKTHGGWRIAQPFPGVFLWRDPHGGLYLVDHTGTRRLGNTA